MIPWVASAFLRKYAAINILDLILPSYSVTVMAVNSEDEAGPTSLPITVSGTVKHFFILTNIYASM